MNITLGSEFERRISEKVDSGLYTSSSEVIRDGLRLLFEKDTKQTRQLEVLRQEVSRGFVQLEEGKFADRNVMDIFDQAQKKADGRI